MSDSHEPTKPSTTGAEPSVQRGRTRRLHLMDVVAILVVMAVVIMLVPAVQQEREAARKSRSKNNLKQIGLALHNYHDVYEVLPPGGIFNARETPFFGWPVFLMPYLDVTPLYDRIDFKVPWDDRRNADVFRQAYRCYLNPSIPETTDNQGFVLTHYVANQNLLFPNSSMSIDDITDGLTQTILVGEIGEGFLPYAQPGNWRDPAAGINASPKSFGRPTRDGAFMLMADGSVFFLQNGIDPEVLKALSTPAGGDDVGTSWP